MSENETVKYPEHEKLSKISDKSQVIGEFLEWLQSVKGVRFAQHRKDTDELWPWHEPTHLLLAEFFDIDVAKIEKEKRGMLDALRTVMMPKNEVGARVMAVSHTKDDKVFVFGLGEYIGDKNPELDDFPTPVGTFMGATNPCIKLDSGQCVWGCECWWGPEDALRTKFAGCEEETIDVDKWRMETRAKQAEGQTDE